MFRYTSVQTIQEEKMITKIHSRTNLVDQGSSNNLELRQQMVICHVNLLLLLRHFFFRYKDKINIKVFSPASDMERMRLRPVHLSNRYETSESNKGEHEVLY